jgi:hypothetical protein
MAHRTITTLTQALQRRRWSGTELTTLKPEALSRSDHLLTLQLLKRWAERGAWQLGEQCEQKRHNSSQAGLSVPVLRFTGQSFDGT